MLTHVIPVLVQPEGHKWFAACRTAGTSRISAPGPANVAIFPDTIYCRMQRHPLLLHADFITQRLRQRRQSAMSCTPQYSLSFLRTCIIQLPDTWLRQCSMGCPNYNQGCTTSPRMCSDRPNSPRSCVPHLCGRVVSMLGRRGVVSIVSPPHPLLCRQP